LKTISDYSGKEYESDDCFCFGNAKQSAAYKLWGAELIDLIVTEEMRWVLVFKKSDHFRFRERWNALKDN
jgi:hypothetical protein